MRVALIFPPYAHKIFSENLSTVDEEFCLAPPIILAYVAAILERHGHKVILVDARASNLSREDALEQIRNFRPDILGFRAETYHFHDALDWIRYFKSKLKIPVIAGGINLSLYPEEVLSYKEIDYGIIGEAIESLPKLISALENSDDFKEISGIAYKDKEEKIIINPPLNKYTNFDAYPFPARHLLPNEKYYSFISQRRNFTIMLASTGCPYRCTFCAIHPNTKYRVRSPGNIINEIEICYKEFKIREIDFFDAVMFLGKSRVLELFRRIKQRNLKIEWSCRSRVDVVDEEILREASKAGCRQIYYGIESVEPAILNNVKKDIAPERVRQAIKWSRKYGIKAMGFFMVGNPGETALSVRKTIEFAKNLGLDFIQVCRAIAKPGTDLDKMMMEITGKDYWREHVRGIKINRRLPTPWSILSEPQIESLTKEFYLKFYFRPVILWNRITQLKSFSEFIRYIKVGFKMVLQKSELCTHILTDISDAEKLLLESSKYTADARLAKVSIVIPTYNEKDNIIRITSAVFKILPQAHVIIVDDDSADGTGDIAQQLSAQNSHIHVIHREGERGLGLAYAEGFKFILNNLDSDYIFEMDADYSHNPQYLPLFLHLAKDFKVVTGSRFLRRVSIKNRTLWRNVLSISTKWIANALLGINTSDISTGFKCFQREALQSINFNKLISKGYAFQIEVSYELIKGGVTIKEIPILFEERNSGVSKMSAAIIAEGLFLVFCLAFKRLLKSGK